MVKNNRYIDKIIISLKTFLLSNKTCYLDFSILSFDYPLLFGYIDLYIISSKKKHNQILKFSPWIIQTNTFIITVLEAMEGSTNESLGVFFFLFMCYKN